jgi:hypothetical protein
MDKIAMGLLCNRSHDGHRKRTPATVKLTPIQGGWQARVIDLTLGYECVFEFLLLDDFFETFCMKSKSPANWREIDYGEGAQTRKAKRKKDFDDAVKGV